MAESSLAVSASISSFVSLKVRIAEVSSGIRTAVLSLFFFVFGAAFVAVSNMFINVGFWVIGLNAVLLQGTKNVDRAIANDGEVIATQEQVACPGVGVDVVSEVFWNLLFVSQLLE